MSLNIKDMNYIVTIAEERKIAKASERLDKNPSSLNRCIKRVEEELGISLFRKTRDGLEATAEGEAYLSAAYEILELAEDLRHL